MADSGRIVKMEVDYTENVDRTLPECQELAKVSLLMYVHTTTEEQGTKIHLSRTNETVYGHS